MIKNRVATRNDQADRRQHGHASGGVRVEKHRMDVAFQMVDADQRLFQRDRQRFAVRDANQQRADQARARA